MRSEIYALELRNIERSESALVKLAHRVFNMLAQQAPLFRRHVAIAALSIKIRRDGRTHDGFGRGAIGWRGVIRTHRLSHLAAICLMPLGWMFFERFGVNANRTGRAGESAGQS